MMDCGRLQARWIKPKTKPNWEENSTSPWPVWRTAWSSPEVQGHHQRSTRNPVCSQFVSPRTPVRWVGCCLKACDAPLGAPPTLTHRGLSSLILKAIIFHHLYRSRRKRQSTRRLFWRTAGWVLQVLPAFDCTITQPVSHASRPSRHNNVHASLTNTLQPALLLLKRHHRVQQSLRTSKAQPTIWTEPIHVVANIG